MAYTTINKSSNYISTKLYTGTGSSQSITGVGFQPDMNWHKTRTTSGYNHCFVDAVRGPTKFLRPNLSNSEDTYTGSFVSFDSDGFSVGADGSNGETNKSGDSFVSWNWKANGTGSSNTDGSISSTVSANTTSGFSIVSWTGTEANATVGHGLGSAPKMIIVKRLNGTTNWQDHIAAVKNTVPGPSSDEAREMRASRVVINWGTEDSPAWTDNVNREVPNLVKNVGKLTSD